MRPLRMRMARLKIAMEQIVYDAGKQLETVTADINRQADEWLEERYPKKEPDLPYLVSQVGLQAMSTEELARRAYEQMRQQQNAAADNSPFGNPYINGQARWQASSDMLSMIGMNPLSRP